MNRVKVAQEILKLAMDAVSDARQHTNQLREMTKRLAREV